MTSRTTIFDLQKRKRQGKKIAMVTAYDATFARIVEEAGLDVMLVGDSLEDVIQHGTGRQAKVIPYPVAGKTGTTNDFTDGWFIGYSPRVVTGVWAGFDRVASLGDKISGARSALPIWIDFMKNIEPPTDEERFIPPDNIVFAQIDPETGFLAERGASDTKQEIFVQGSEPSEHTPQRVNPRDFFNLDHATP